MDERVKNAYLKIYAELFQICLMICSVSIVVKIIFLDRGIDSCVLEYLILVGSTVYTMIRSRMMGVTQATAYKNAPKKRWVALVIGLFVAIIIVAIFKLRQGEELNAGNLVKFAIPFVLCFLAVQFGMRKWEEARQRKLDSRFDERE